MEDSFVRKVFLISDFRRVLKLVCFLLGISPASADVSGSETSAKLNQTPGKYPKENIQEKYFFLKFVILSGKMLFR
jgi:hypothetical protein